MFSTELNLNNTVNLTPIYLKPSHYKFGFFPNKRNVTPATNNHYKEDRQITANPFHQT
jgi:hypothetical protein